MRSWDAGYLLEAAESWARTAELWDDAYWQAYQRVQRPGGIEWMGAAAQATVDRVAADRREVVGSVDALHAASNAARAGAGRLSSAREQVLAAVAEAQAAGFDIDEGYAVMSRERVPPAAQATVQAQAEGFANRIHTKVLALMSTDREVAAQITAAAAVVDRVRSSPERTPTVQAVDFHGIPLPEKPPKPPAIPPAEGWSEDPLMRAAQKIAYGHASDPVDGHMADFPGMTKDQLAEMIRQKLQRAISNPTGLTMGVSKSDGVPVIYDPKDNVMIIRDTRPNAPDGGTVFKPNNPTDVPRKFGWYESVFRPGQLEDGTGAASAEPQTLPPVHGGVGMPAHPGGVVAAIPGPTTAGGNGGGDSWGDGNPKPATLPEWGTFVSPHETAEHGGEMGNLGKFLEPMFPHPPNDPDHTA